MASGGGAGGSINVTAGRLSGSGVLEADGGGGAFNSQWSTWYVAGGGGSGGRISVKSTSKKRENMNFQL